MAMTPRPPVPASRHVELVLVWYDLLPVPAHFQIQSIVGTTYYVPGEKLTREEAEQCCADGWRVTMLDNNVLAMLMSSFLSLPKLSLPLPTI